MRDTLAYLNLAFEDNVFTANKALLRVINKPSRGFGDKIMETLTAEARELGIPLIRHVVSGAVVKKDQRCEDLRSIIKTIRNIAQDKQKHLHSRVAKILQEAGLISHYTRIDPSRVSNINLFLNLIFDQNFSDIEEIKERLRALTKYSADKDVVYLSTIHGSKGLEFDYVFVMHMDEGKIPSKFTLAEKDAFELEKRLNEERRLTYVAFTRAKRALFLSSAFGEEAASRYVKDVEHKLLKAIDLFSDQSDGDVFDGADDSDDVDMYSDEDTERNSDLTDDNEED